jgi:uncharacterized protein GlcG (DUF336 family)
MTLDQALEVVERGRKAATEAGIAATIAVVDTGGHLIALGRMDGSAFMTVDVATAKAWTAASVKIPTSMLHGFVAGDVAFLSGAAAATGGKFLASPGGAPVVIDGEVVGGVGVSGGSTDQDAQVAEAAAGSS